MDLRVSEALRNISIGSHIIQYNTKLHFKLEGHVFAHEWSKYRYGVFDEFGYPGDSLYPAFYVNPRNADELLPNFCTITHVKGMAV